MINTTTKRTPEAMSFSLSGLRRGEPSRRGGRQVPQASAAFLRGPLVLRRSPLIIRGPYHALDLSSGKPNLSLRPIVTANESKYTSDLPPPLTAEIRFLWTLEDSQAQRNQSRSALADLREKSWGLPRLEDECLMNSFPLKRGRMVKLLTMKVFAVSSLPGSIQALGSGPAPRS